MSEREGALEGALRLLQQFHLDLEKFLNWLTEAETTCNVLVDATSQERLQEQPHAAKNLLAQWKVEPGGAARLGGGPQGSRESQGGSVRVCRGSTRVREGT